jgi:hypothetical protein
MQVRTMPNPESPTQLGTLFLDLEFRAVDENYLGAGKVGYSPLIMAKVIACNCLNYLMPILLTPYLFSAVIIFNIERILLCYEV